MKETVFEELDHNEKTIVEYEYIRKDGRTSYQLTADGSSCCGMAGLSNMTELWEEDLKFILEDKLSVTPEDECEIYGNRSVLRVRYSGSYLVYVTLTDDQMVFVNENTDVQNHVLLHKMGFKHCVRWRNPNSGNYVNLLTKSLEEKAKPPFTYGKDTREES